MDFPRASLENLRGFARGQHPWSSTMLADLASLMTYGGNLVHGLEKLPPGARISDPVRLDIAAESAIDALLADESAIQNWRMVLEYATTVARQRLLG